MSSPAPITPSLFHRFHTMSNHFYISRSIFANRTAFYSWPSAGSLFGYKADRSQITEEAVRDLQDFLLILADKTGAERISVVAHSMGNEFLTLALEQMTQDRPGEKLFNEVIFPVPKGYVLIFRVSSVLFAS